MLWCTYFLLLLGFVVFVMTIPSGNCLYGGEGVDVPRDEEFHHTLIVLEHICDVN